MLSKQQNSGNALIAILVILVIAFAVIAGPYALIWSLNTLFGLNIVFGFDTWLAAFLVIGIFAPPKSVTIDKS